MRIAPFDCAARFVYRWTLNAIETISAPFWCRTSSATILRSFSEGKTVTVQRNLRQLELGYHYLRVLPVTDFFI